jgi:hypothetical protein
MKANHADLKVGQRVTYIQRTGYGLAHDWRATIVKITPKRVTITLDEFPHWKPITVNPDNLRHREFEAAGELLQGEPPYDDYPAGAYLTPSDRDLPYEFQID